MDFTLEELRSTLVDMGLENIPDSHLELFAKGIISFFLSIIYPFAYHFLFK